jgi:hypothetical protein
VIPLGAPLKKYDVIKVALVYAIVRLFLFGSAEAQDLDPRRYVNLPTNQNFLRVAGGHSEGDVNTSPTIPLEDAFLAIDGASLAYLRTMDIGGKASSFDVFLPYFCASGSLSLAGEPQDRDVCGQGDTIVRMTYNFVGAKAMELSEFVKSGRETVVGASLQVYIPTGRYDDGELLNIGANRWVIKPEIGMSIPRGKWSFELSAGVRFFTDNDEFVGDVKLEQDPLYNLQAHLIYDLSPRQWISLNGNYFVGGDTYRDSVPIPSRQENSRVGLAWYVAVNPKNGLKFVAHTGVITRIGNDSDAYSVEWIYRWD